jgi:hypothetical protein
VSEYAYTIEPIHADAPADPAIDVLLEQLGFVFAPPAPIVVGWQLRLCVDSVAIEQRDCMGHAEGWVDAERTGGAWFAEHNTSLGMQWFAHAEVGFQRMAWDHDFAQALTKRGF